jgi:hypothetical protein
MLKALGLAAILAVPSLAAAQKEATKKDYQPQVRRIDIDDGDVVDGELMGPDGRSITAIKFGPRESLIKFRWDFIPELIKSANDH